MNRHDVKGWAVVLGAYAAMFGTFYAVVTLVGGCGASNVQTVEKDLNVIAGDVLKFEGNAALACQSKAIGIEACQRLSVSAAKAHDALVMAQAAEQSGSSNAPQTAADATQAAIDFEQVVRDLIEAPGKDGGP